MTAFPSATFSSHGVLSGVPASSSTPWALRDSRRGTSRREVTLPCQAVREHDFKLIAERTLDISIDGLLLPLRTRVLTGESVIVSFAIPGMWIDVEATVARVVHGRRPGDDGLAVGLIFDRIAPSVRAALAGFLHGRRSPLPRRGPLARLRRGSEAPQLADEALITNMVASQPEEIVDMTHEAIDVTDGAEATHESVDEMAVGTTKTVGAAVDGLGVLRAVVGAWQSLIVENGAANSE